MLNETNRHHLKPTLMLKVIDKIVADKPTGAHRAKENLSRLFKWAIVREHIERNSAQYIELPKVKSKQRLSSRHLIIAMLELSKERPKLKFRLGFPQSSENPLN